MYSSNELFVTSRPFTEMTTASPGMSFHGVIACTAQQTKSAKLKQKAFQQFLIPSFT
jgi:hypothetical protein